MKLNSDAGGRGLLTPIKDCRSGLPLRRGFLTRRTLLKTAAAATPLSALLNGLPSGWVGTAYADDSPEQPNMRFGMIALTDCAPIVMAHELGYFKKFGINSTISKEASWAVIRDKLSL